jgi:hypothetical protein
MKGQKFTSVAHLAEDEWKPPNADISLNLIKGRLLPDKKGSRQQLMLFCRVMPMIQRLFKVTGVKVI